MKLRTFLIYISRFSISSDVSHVRQCLNKFDTALTHSKHSRSAKLKQVWFCTRLIKTFVYYIWIVVFLYGITSCSKEGDTEGKSSVEIASAKSLEVYPGKNRAKLTWKVTEPIVRKAAVHVDNNHVMTIPREAGDAMSIILTDLEEKNHSFSIYLQDDAGHSSVGAKITATVYGDTYIHSLTPRVVKEASCFNGRTTISWGNTLPAPVWTEIRYTDSGGTIKQLPVTPDTGITELENYPCGSDLEYRTGYLPQPNAIDTFFTDFTVMPVPDRTGDFTIAVIPDPQVYTYLCCGASMDMFTAQTDWIQNNREAENIAYVACVGDLTDSGDKAGREIEWERAANAMYRLEEPISIPYGCAVGNHDQVPSAGNPFAPTIGFNKYFGIDHFSKYPYYGGHYGDKNDCHYDLFSAGGIDFIVVYLTYDDKKTDWVNMNDWAYDLLTTHANRKGIIVTHWIIGKGYMASFSPQGEAIYERLKICKNLFMMLGGHITGEGYREDTYNGHTVKTFMVDFQSHTTPYPNGGDGYMLLLKLSAAQNLTHARIYSPFRNANMVVPAGQYSNQNRTFPLFQ